MNQNKAEMDRDCYVISDTPFVVHRGGCSDCPPNDPLTGKPWAARYGDSDD